MMKSSSTVKHIRFKNTIEDRLALARRIHVSYKWLKALRFVVYFGLVAYLGMLQMKPPNELEIVRSLFPPAVVFFVMLPLAESLIVYFAPVNFNPESLDTEAIQITEQGVCVDLQDTQECIGWDEIISIQADDHYLYLVTGDKRSQVIPRRAFDSPEQSTTFLSNATSYHQQQLALT